MTEDERVVREAWENIGIYGYGGTTRYVNLPDACRDQFMGESEDAAWSAARAFTEQRLEEVRQLREEIGVINEGIEVAAQTDYASHVKYGIPFKRILARLEAALTNLTRGMKEQGND